MNAINIVYECDCNYRICDFFIEQRPNGFKINLGNKKKVCIYEKFGECTNSTALKEAVKRIPKQWWNQ